MNFSLIVMIMLVILQKLFLFYGQKLKKIYTIKLFIKKIISFSEKDSLLKFIEDTFNHISSNEIYAIIKILTGGLRVGVSNGILKNV